MDMTAPSCITASEHLAHRTWPCRAEESLGDWILREADGFTRRANSCLALGDPGMPLDDAVAAVEDWYRARDLEPCVKICPDAPEGLDHLLCARGWSVATPSLVLRRDLSRDSPASPPEFSASATPDADWLRTVSLWDGESPDKARHHGELAARMRSAGFLRWTVSDAFLAVGVISTDGHEAFLYDVVVHPNARGRGIGRAFCIAALGWAHSCGIRAMSLQVLESNTVARALYASLGFAEHHRYHYRVATGAKPTCGC
mgnify:CR=1 FL=1